MCEGAAGGGGEAVERQARGQGHPRAAPFIVRGCWLP